jgi:hypothetical protein
VTDPCAIWHTEPYCFKILCFSIAAAIIGVIIVFFAFAFTVFRHRDIVQLTRLMAAIRTAARTILSLKPADYTQHVILVSAGQDRLASLGGDVIKADCALCHDECSLDLDLDLPTGLTGQGRQPFKFFTYQN